MQKVLQVGLAVLREILVTAADQVWDDLWAVIVREAAEAEEAWKAGIVTNKKATVIKRVTGWLTSKVKLSRIQQWVIGLVIGYLIDALIKELNELLGHDWAIKVEEQKSQVEELIPWLQAE